ncbi:MAG: glycosyltransferase [Saprospiraceae bacterium]
MIVAKNESENLKQNLPLFFSQLSEYLSLNVIDDYSNDDSIEYLSGLVCKNSEFSFFKNEFRPGKKHAISFGIKQFSADVILFTDADCYPNSPKWGELMVSKFDDNTNFVLGYSPYLKGKGLLNKFIRFETFMTALQYFSYYLVKIPYMGVGRNMAIRKKVFTENGGYEKHIDIKSGSDDLLINEFGDYSTIKIQTNPESFIFSIPKESYLQFLKQKARHISTSFKYKLHHKLLLGIYSSSHILVYVLFLTLIFTKYLLVVLLLMLLRYIIIYDKF